MTETPAMTLERKSSAVTLSDMEMFIFPELMYSLVLANIMSPRIWKWRDDPWFAGLQRMKPYRRIARLKQFIMDHYVFNLDLDTWGLTNKDDELRRFSGFIGEDTLSQSNALFGYEGDKYYFDIDIRTHFGLDKYDGNIIPYWKTETVEAMDAFVHRNGYDSAAGECVSLAALYASALFIVAGIPLKDIYLTATPLHSQNFVDVNDGILTNNRRLVTKNMWFNGTELSAQARRAFENERVSIVTHETGWIHAVYDQATMDQNSYRHFRDQLHNYLKVDLTAEVLGNFLRSISCLQNCFQIRCQLHGSDHYVKAERVFAYEHGSPYRLTDNTRDKLFAEIDHEELRHAPIDGRIMLNDLEDFVKTHRIDLDNSEDVALLRQQFDSACMNKDTVIERLLTFCQVQPRLPDQDQKEFVADSDPLGIDLEMSRMEIIDRLESIRQSNSVADMAFFAYRDLSRTEPEPFLRAAMFRNPVSVEATRDIDERTVTKMIRDLPGDSVYDEPGRLAQPDEVWNYGRGDGLEKAILLGNIIGKRHEGEIEIDIGPSQATLKADGREVGFPTTKELKEQTWRLPDSR